MFLTQYMTLLYPVGGDTLWARYALSDYAKGGPELIVLHSYSGYEAYDRLSPAFKRFLEGLTAIHNADFFVDVSNTTQTCTLRKFITSFQMARESGHAIQDPRGSPENTGSDLTAVQYVHYMFCHSEIKLIAHG